MDFFQCAAILVCETAKKKLSPAHVIVFNHEVFESHGFRKGSTNDVKALKKTFKELKCKLQIIQNATVDTVRSTVKKCELYFILLYSI